MSEFKIERGVEIPPSGTGKHNMKYPFAEMEVGDSFFCSVNGVGMQRQTNISALRNAAKGFSLRHGIQLTARVVKEEQGAGIHIWRVK